MPIFRIDSSDKQVFINDTRLMGVQACNVNSPKQTESIQPAGRIGFEDRIQISNQTTDLTIDFMLCDSNTNDPFFDFQSSGILSTETFDFDIKDLSGETNISGSYMTSYSIRGAVRELVEGSVVYECDIIGFNETGNLTVDDQSSDSYGVYQPSDITVSSSGFNREGISTSGICIQNFDLSFSIPRRSKNRLGVRTPRVRYPELPANGQLVFSAIKNKITGIDLSPLVLDQGQISIKLNTEQPSEREYLINNCSLISVAENHVLDEDATLDFTYVFSIINDDITVTDSGISP